MSWPRALTAGTVLAGLGGRQRRGVVRLCQKRLRRWSRGTPPAPHCRTGPAAEVLAMQTAAPASGTKAREPLIDDKTELAIKSGLAWLAKVQKDNGSFGMGTFKGGIASTSLAAMAFMAGGSGPGRGPHGTQVEKALQYVLDRRPSGFLQAHTAATHGPMYDHAFGTLFLSEAYDLTKRPEIRDKLKKAVRLIVDCQNDEGGWRYQPRRGDADLSVTVCQLNALRPHVRPGCLCRPRRLRRASATPRSPEPRRGLSLHVPGGRQRLPPFGGRRARSSSIGGPTPRRSTEAFAYLRQYKPENQVRQSSPTTSTATTTPRRRCQRGGDDWKRGTRPSATSSSSSEPPGRPGQTRGYRLRHGDGTDHPAGTQELPADVPGRQESVHPNRHH